MFTWIYKSAGLVLALGLLAFAVSEEVLNRYVLAQPWLALACVAIAVLLLYLPALRGARRTLHSLVFGSPRRRFNLALFLAGAAIYAVACWLIFDGLPRLDDEVSALFQGRILASGRVVLPAPQPPDFFRTFGTIDGVRGYEHLCSMYPPGHPALLALGSLLGVPWLVNPLLGGGLVVLTAELGRQLYGRRTGRLAGLLALLSPSFLLMSSSHLSHIPTAFFCALCMWSVVRLLRTRSWGFGALAGFAMGMAFLSRPLTALVVGVVIGLAPLWYWRRALVRWRAVGAALLLAALGVGALLAYQQEATGDFRVAGHEVGLGRRAKYGFGKIDFARTHTVELGIEHTARRMEAMNRNVLGWPVPVFLLALLPFLSGRARREDVWLLLPSLGLLLAYMAFWYFEHYYPGRYIFAGVPMLIVLAARGCMLAASALRRRPELIRRAAPTAATACVLFNLFVFLPNYTASYGGTFADVEMVLPRVLEDHDFSNSVLFMDAVERSQDYLDPFNDFYGTGFMLNDLDFSGDMVFARNLRERNAELVERHPDRDYYLYRYHRTHDKALLYRLEFGAEGQVAVPLEVASDHVLPHPTPDQVAPAGAGD